MKITPWIKAIAKSLPTAVVTAITILELGLYVIEVAERIRDKARKDEEEGEFHVLNITGRE